MSLILANVQSIFLAQSNCLPQSVVKVVASEVEISFQRTKAGITDITLSN